MDPLHKTDYQEWMLNIKENKEPLSEEILNQIRDMSLSEVDSSMKKLQYTGFNPMKPRYRV